MENRLEGKFAVITGATSGIGEATARSFAKAGCRLAITGRRESRLEALKRELVQDYGANITTHAFDIRDKDACGTFAGDLPDSVDILVNNAGLSQGMDRVYEANLKDWETMIDTNIKGLLYMTRLISPQMLERNRGHIINIGSTAGHESYQGGSVYCGTKHAVRAISEATKKDLHGSRVRVSMVSPGLVETEFSKVRFKGDEERAGRVYEGMQPLTAKDIAEIVYFVANRPPHVNILDAIVVPVDQSSSTMVHRDE